MAAGDRAVGGEADMGEDVAAERLDEGEPLAWALRGGKRGADRPGGKTDEHRLDQVEALADLGDANPYAGVDVASPAGRDLEGQRVVGRVGVITPGVEVAARGAPD